MFERERFQYALLDFAIKTFASDALDDDSDNYVVGVCVRPALTSGKQRLGVQNIRNEFFRFPHAVGIGSHCCDEIFVKHMFRDAARVIHQHSERYVFGVRQTIEPRFAPKPTFDLFIELEFSLVNELKGDCRKVSLPDATGKH